VSGINLTYKKRGRIVLFSPFPVELNINTTYFLFCTLLNSHSRQSPQTLQYAFLGTLAFLQSYSLHLFGLV
jgi:hypothetical protein